MAKRSRRTPLPKPLLVALAALAAVAAGVVFWLLGRTTEENWGIEAAYALADGNVLLIERAGLNNSSYDDARLRIVARSGHELRRSETIDQAVRPYGVVDGGIWIDTVDGGLELWTLSELAPRPGAKAAFASVPVLVQRREFKGTSGGVLALIGNDGRHYTVDSGYAIERQDKGFEPHLPSGAPVALVAAVALDRTELVQPRVVSASSGDAILLPNAKSLLVTSTGLDGTEATLSRVDEGGLVRWSVTARQLVGATELDEPFFGFVLIELADRTVFAIAQGTSIQTTRSEDSARTWGEHQIRLADIDVEDGRVLGTRPIIAAQ
jgi:hypothetical protein